MINFPILEALKISNFGLYPGTSQSPGIDVNFQSGLTLVLGANGLGKTTLITILFRLLTGPYDIPALASRNELGSANLKPTQLPYQSKKTFSDRVTDGARDAKGQVSLKLGNSQILIERKLSDLTLTTFSVDGEVLPLSEVDSFQGHIARLAGVWSFGDWILLLRHLVFYFEDRRALVWDPSAQRQILRFLFLSPDLARKWTEEEREILTADSRLRNLNATLTREERDLALSETKAQSAPDVRQELKTLQNLQEIDHSKLLGAEESVADLDQARHNARLRYMKAQQEREARLRDFERAKLTTIQTRFPTRSETARYVVAQLLTEKECLVCGTVSPSAAKEYAARIEKCNCVICDTPLVSDKNIVSSTQLADERAKTLENELKEIERELHEADLHRQAVAESVQQNDSLIGHLNAAMAERSAQIQSLSRRLPPDESDVHQMREDLASLRGRASLLRAELKEKRAKFKEFMAEISRSMALRAEDVKIKFSEFALGFLIENCSLVWAPKSAAVGQTGEAVDFPSFDIDMSGSDFATPVRRNGPEQVSESQREFIDTAFRMALISVAGSEKSGSLVFDAPESSLDAVFVKRAADVLSRFGVATTHNRLIITSNLVDGKLIPALLSQATTKADRESRIIDLFSIAAPTAAVREFSDEYEQIKKQFLGTSTEAVDG